MNYTKNLPNKLKLMGFEFSNTIHKGKYEYWAKNGFTVRIYHYGQSVQVRKGEQFIRVKSLQALQTLTNKKTHGGG